jgi:hypothetical protein
MGIGPAMNPNTMQGAANLAAMEYVVEIGRPFTMIEVEQFISEIRTCWDWDLLMIIDSDPLTFEVTLYGHQLIERGRKEREKMLRKIEQEQALAA